MNDRKKVLSKKMLSKKLGVAVVAIAAAATLGLAYRSLAARGTHRDRYDDARARLDADCARWKTVRGGDGVVCHLDQNPRKLVFRDPLAKVKAADAKLDRGDESGAVRDLRYALDGAADLDRSGTPIAEMMAAKIISDVLNVIEARSPSRGLSKASASSLLAGRKLTSAAHPLEGERLFLLSAIASRPELLPAPARPFATIHAVDAMAEENAVTASMEYAIRMRDTPACVEAGSKRKLTADYAVSSEMLCSKLVNVVFTAKRLDRARERERI